MPDKLEDLLREHDPPPPWLQEIIDETKAAIRAAFDQSGRLKRHVRLKDSKQR